MGLFSTLTTKKGGGASASLPTMLQMYTTNALQLDDTCELSPFAAMTYQATQVGNISEPDSKQQHHLHISPDLGIWNCRVQGEGLVDAVLEKVHYDAICWAVDLSDEAGVEPCLSKLQAALVRHLIEHHHSSDADREEETKKTATTSLYKLQVTQFGKADSDEASKDSSPINIDESHQSIMTPLMICAIVPAEDATAEVSEQAYRKKQAKALLIYHLRKFAIALDASLVFVTPKETIASSSNPASPQKQQPQEPQPAPTSTAAVATQPTVTLETLSQLWRDFAKGELVWKTSGETGTVGEPETVDHDVTPVYGPGRHQEDVVETVLLRNAHYPGHWDAQKDSVWVALPAPFRAAPDATSPSVGDGGWLHQLRSSIVADAPPPTAAEASATEEAPKEKDAAVSSFFESLLKNP